MRRAFLQPTHAPLYCAHPRRRSALEAVRQQGLPSSSQQRRARQQYTSRVHVYDICQTIMASINRPNPGRRAGRGRQDA